MTERNGRQAAESKQRWRWVLRVAPRRELEPRLSLPQGERGSVVVSWQEGQKATYEHECTRHR